MVVRRRLVVAWVSACRETPETPGRSLLANTMMLPWRAMAYWPDWLRMIHWPDPVARQGACAISLTDGISVAGAPLSLQQQRRHFDTNTGRETRGLCRPEYRYLSGSCWPEEEVWDPSEVSVAAITDSRLPDSLESSDLGEPTGRQSLRGGAADRPGATRWPGMAGCPGMTGGSGSGPP